MNANNRNRNAKKVWVDWQELVVMKPGCLVLRVLELWHKLLIKKVGVNENFAHNSFDQLKELAFLGNLELARSGLALFTFGNASAADQNRKVFAIKPSGVPYNDLTVDMMVVVDFDGNTVQGSMRPSSDTRTHAVLYKHWPNVAGIAHTHSKFATAWAQSLLDIPILGTTHADHVDIDIPCVPPLDDRMITKDYEYETGCQILKYLRDKVLSYEKIRMILLGGHAPFTWGNNCHEAVYNSAILESIAEMAYMTTQIRSDAPRLKKSLISKHFDRKHGRDSYYGQ